MSAKSRKEYVYIVEWYSGTKWRATEGVSLSRKDGFKELRDWRLDTPDYDYRLARYEFKKVVK